MIRKYQIRWEGCSSKFDTWELEDKIQKADPAAVWRWDMEMHAALGLPKPRAGGGVSRKAVVPTSEIRRSERLKTQVSSTSSSCSKSSASSNLRSPSARLPPSSLEASSSTNSSDALTKEEV